MFIIGDIFSGLIYCDWLEEHGKKPDLFRLFVLRRLEFINLYSTATVRGLLSQGYGLGLGYGYGDGLGDGIGDGIGNGFGLGNGYGLGLGYGFGDGGYG